MPNILCIETSTTMCSVALCNADGIVAFKEVNEGYTHAENLHVFIDEVVKQSGISKKELNVVAVGKGPGSYTGLRIGVSAAKGIAYALGIPLISVNTLYNLSAKAKELTKETDIVLCPMLDARRMEVYTAMYDGNDLREIQVTHSLVVDENTVLKFDTNKHLVFFGDGMPKCREHLSALKNASFLENIFPSALNMKDYVLQAYKEQRFEDVAYFEPFYLKEFFTGK